MKLSSSVSPRSIPKKKKKLPNLPAQLIHDRIMLSYFLFLSEPVEMCPSFDLPHIQSVKEQIFIAQVQCNALSYGNKFKRSTSRNNRVKKLKKRIRWLSTYFLDSFVETRPDGKKIRKTRVTQSNRISEIPKTGSESMKSVTARKRRKFRLQTKIHKGSYHAPSGLPPPQVDTRSDEANVVKQPEKVDNPVGRAFKETIRHDSKLSELVPKFKCRV